MLFKIGFSLSKRVALYQLHSHHCNAKGFALFRRLVHLQVIQPACPEAGQSANMCKRPPFGARGRTMIRGGSGQGSTLLTLFQNIQQCCYTLCFLFPIFLVAKRFPSRSTSIEEVTLEETSSINSCGNERFL